MCREWGAGGVSRSACKGSEIVDKNSPHGLVGWWGLCCCVARGYCSPLALSACQRAVVVGIAVYSSWKRRYTSS